MLIRFNKELPACSWEHLTEAGKLIRLDFKSIDQADILAWSRSKSGFKIPDDCWRTEVVDGMQIRRIDRSLMSEEQVKALSMDDYLLGASRLFSIHGIMIEADDGVQSEADVSCMTQENLASILDLVARQYPEFQIWFALYLDGAKKKSGQMEID